MISVIVPTFRRPALLVDTLRSLQTQQHRDIEVLVCDNGADSATQKVVESLHDSRFHWIARERNLGIQQNTILGFRSAAGEFVFKIDDDDLIAADALPLLHRAALENPDAVLTFGTLIDAPWIKGAKEARGLVSRAPAAPLPGTRFDGFADVVARSDIHLGACLIRRAALDRIQVNPEAATAFDLDILFKLSDGVAVHVPEARVFYRQHLGSDSITAPVPQTLGALAVYREVAATHSHPLPSVLRRGYRDVALRAAAALIREGRTEEARELLDELPPDLSTLHFSLIRAVTHLPAGASWLARAAHARYLRSLRQPLQHR